MNTEEFFAAPESATREPARPKAINPETGREQSWTRASNHAAALDNPFGLIKSNLRKLVLGLSRRHDLGRMLLAGAAIDDKSKADEIINAALAAAESDAKANEGTAAHAVLSRSYLGHETPSEFETLVNVFVRALRENGLTPRAAEQTVLNTTFGVRGTFDWVFEEADGTFVIGDVKTGEHLDLAKRNFAVQLADYAGAGYLLRPDGTSDHMPWTLAQTHAVLVHIDLETLGVSVYRVDLHIGRLGAQLAEQVRQWHKLDPLMPYVPPLQRSDASNSVGPAPVAVKNRGTVDAIAIGAEPPERPHLVAVPDIEPSEGLAPATNEHGGSVPVKTTRTFEDLMKLDKAPLQTIIKKEFGGTDIAHNRRWLARWIVAVQDGADHKAAAKYAAAKDDAAPEKPAVAPSQKTYDPAGLILAAIKQMKTVDGIRAFQARRIEEHGDQGWTDEMAQAASERLAELNAAQASNAVASVLTRIAEVTAVVQIRDLWNEVTLNGTDATLWTAEMQQAAEKRAEEIKAAAQAVAPNPWGA